MAPSSIHGLALKTWSKPPGPFQGQRSRFTHKAHQSCRICSSWSRLLSIQIRRMIMKIRNMLGWGVMKGSVRAAAWVVPPVGLAAVRHITVS